MNVVTVSALRNAARWVVVFINLPLTVIRDGKLVTRQAVRV